MILQMGKWAETLGDLLPHCPKSGFEPGPTNGDAGPLRPCPALPRMNAGGAGPAADSPASRMEGRAGH